MSNSTNTKDDEIIKEIRSIMRDWEGNFPFPEPDNAGYEAQLIHETPKALLGYFKKLLTKDRQQLIQRVREEVIGEDETSEDEIENDLFYATRNGLRQTQREILETMEKEHE